MSMNNINSTELSIESVDDKRVENSPVRHQYRVLSDVEKEQVTHIKDLSKELIEYLNLFYHTEELWDTHGLDMAVHYTRLASMLGVAHITK